MTTDPIKHVVVLMLENHSFDQMLGSFRSIIPDLEGVDPANLRTNQDKDGTMYSQALTAATSVTHDPMHELDNVLHQLENNNANFVLDYSENYPATTSNERQQIMGYFAPGSLPALHEIARHFTICDHWYSSVPGPTWANRFFVHSGTCLGRVRMPQNFEDGILHPDIYFGYDQDTIYDRLNERGIPWRIYHGDIPQSLVLSHQWRVENASRYEFMDVFFSDAKGQQERFPAYCFIEPRYYLPGQNDDHPPHTTLRAQALLASVYNALRENDALWNSTLFVVLYDEHGDRPIRLKRRECHPRLLTDLTPSRLPQHQILQFGQEFSFPYQLICHSNRTFRLQSKDWRERWVSGTVSVTIRRKTVPVSWPQPGG